MNEPAVTERSQRVAIEAFDKLGAHEARLEAHDGRLSAVEERLRTYDSRAQQLQSQIARLAGISETTLAGLNKIEELREGDRKELTQALLAALSAAPKTNRAGSVIGMLLGSVALAVVIVLIVLGRLQ